MKQRTLAIEGMMCDGCAGTVREALTDVAGVEYVDVALEEKRARLTVDEGTPDSELTTAVAAVGYEASIL